MQAVQQYYTSIGSSAAIKETLVHKFLTWCKSQEKNRLLWLALIIAGHGCFLTPLTVMLIMLSGNSMLLWAFAMGAMAIPLVCNLAALPVRITLPVFFASLVIDLAIITISIISI